MSHNPKSNTASKTYLDTPNYAHVNMTNITHYMNNPKIQYVDIREELELYIQGYLNGFDLIPFYSELVDKNIIKYEEEFSFQSDAILNQPALEQLFDKNKTVFLICRSGRRSSYLKDALAFIGYNVYNIGGIIDYKKQNTK